MTSMEQLTAALFDAATPRVVTRRQKRAAKQARKGRRAAGNPAEVSAWQEQCKGEAVTDTTDYAHDVCFACRKAWAPATIKSRRAARTSMCIRESRRTCPDCGGSTIGLGLAFKPPKQNDRRAWRKAEAAALAGNRFRKP